MHQNIRLKDGNTLVLTKMEGHGLITFYALCSCGDMKIEIEADTLYCWTPGVFGLFNILKVWFKCVIKKEV